MSRTDKTDPFWVLMRTRYYKAEEVHDHRFSDCDLKPLDEWSHDDGWWFSRGTCYWTFRYDGRNVCCCSMCHGAWGWYSDTQRDIRHDTKQLTKRWVAEYRANGDIEEWWA